MNLQKILKIIMLIWKPLKSISENLSKFILSSFFNAEKTNEKIFISIVLAVWIFKDNTLDFRPCTHLNMKYFNLKTNLLFLNSRGNRHNFNAVVQFEQYSQPMDLFTLQPEFDERIAQLLLLWSTTKYRSKSTQFPRKSCE